MLLSIYGELRGAKITPFGAPFGFQFRANTGTFAGLGPKPTPGSLKGNL